MKLLLILFLFSCSTKPIVIGFEGSDSSIKKDSLCRAEVDSLIQVIEDRERRLKSLEK